MGIIRHIMNIYFAACVAAVYYVPLFLLHGYRYWWPIAMYATLVIITAAGAISHYRNDRRNRES